METVAPVELPKYKESPLKIVREFIPWDPGDARSAGRLIVRANNGGHRLAIFDKLFEVMAKDALTFQPPIKIDREDVDAERYLRYSGTSGVEVTIPEGHSISPDYRRIGGENQPRPSYLDAPSACGAI